MVAPNMFKNLNCYISLTRTFSTLPSMALANPTHTEIRRTAEADTNLTVLQASRTFTISSGKGSEEYQNQVSNYSEKEFVKVI